MTTAPTAPNSPPGDAFAQPTETYLRHYRVAAVPHTDSPAHLPAKVTVGHAELVERHLRARLAAGERPDVVLVSPERSTAVPATGDGRLPGRPFAWEPGAPFMYRWLHSPHVLAELIAQAADPDPLSEVYADQGSVILKGAVIQRLMVTSWLAPVADTLSAKYGCPVEVLGGADVPAPEVAAAPPFVVRKVLDPEVCAAVEDYLRTNIDRAVAPPNRKGLARPYLPPPPELLPLLEVLCRVTAAHFDLPMTNLETAIALYEEGDAFQEHTDLYDPSPNTYDRTVSYSLLLSEPGRDFDGGDLLINGEPVEAHAGDLVGFTAMTPHEVTEITRGERLVVVCFGEVVR